jgi:hypothetical protein
LYQKLGIRAGDRIALVNAPQGYDEWLGGLPEGVAFLELEAGELDFIHLFSSRQSELHAWISRLKKMIHPGGMIWISWPKRASRVASDLDANVVRSIGLEAGLVDVKVVSVNPIWSGLKFVIPIKDR